MEEDNNTGTHCMNPIKPGHQYILTLLSLCCGSISLIFCLLIFSIIILFRKYRLTTQRVILYLTVSVFLSSVAYILHGSELGPLAGNVTYCTITGFIDQVTGWMVLLAVCCLTFDLFMKVVFLKFDTIRYEVVYCIVIFLIPFSFNWIPFIYNAYGDSGAYCWIRESKIHDCEKMDYYAISLRFALYWIPYLLILFAITTAFIYLRVKAYKQLKAYSGNFNPQEQTVRQMINRELRLYQPYPVIMVLTFTGAILSRIAEVTKPKDHLFSLRIIHVICMSLQGLALAIVFALDYDTRQQLTQYHSIKLALYNLFCCCRIESAQEYKAVPVPTDSLKYGTFRIDERSNSDSLVT